MTRAEVVRAAEASPYLAGHPLRAVDPRVAVAALLIGAGFGLHWLLVSLSPASVGTFFVGLFATFALMRWSAQTAVRHVNLGTAAILEEHLDRARSELVIVATGWHLRTYVAMALQNLGIVALKSGDYADAVALLRAALSELDAARFAFVPQPFRDLLRANYALALIATDSLDAAEAILAAPNDADALPTYVAYMTRARALLAMRRGCPAEALAILDREGRLLRNVLTGNEAALAEAMEAHALTLLGGVYAGAPRPPVPVVADAQARAFVAKLLPGSEGLIVPA